MLNSAGVFDVFAISVSGTLTLCVPTNGSGGGWASDTGGSNTARGSGYSQIDRSTRSYPTNANAITHCYNGSTDEGSISANKATYLGTFYTSGAGQISYNFGAAASGGTAGLFGLWNMYNRVYVTNTVTDSGTGYTYTTATTRQARASSGNQIAFVYGLAEDGISASYTATMATTANTGALGNWGVGEDSTVGYNCQFATFETPAAAAIAAGINTTCNYVPQIGYHVISANETGDGSHANTFDYWNANSLTISGRF